MVAGSCSRNASRMKTTIVPKATKVWRMRDRIPLKSWKSLVMPGIRARRARRENQVPLPLLPIEPFRHGLVIIPWRGI